MVSRKEPDWQELAEKRLKAFIARARKQAALKRKGPARAPWQVAVHLVGASAMKTLNRKHRGKNHATDVLSFSSPQIFFEKGILGELIVCVPVMKKQAKKLGHDSAQELDVLLVHGLLHLLGFDHEQSARASRVMAKRESELLGRTLRARGLIVRQA